MNINIGDMLLEYIVETKNKELFLKSFAEIISDLLKTNDPATKDVIMKHAQTVHKNYTDYVEALNNRERNL